MSFADLEKDLQSSQAVKKFEGFFSEFWKFAAKGNIFDLAVGVILGNAFGAIVNSLVADVVTPLLSLATNNVNFSTWSYSIRPPIVLSGTTTPELVIGYGHLLQVTINFLVVALCIFIFYKLFSRLRESVQRKEEAQEEKTPPHPVSTQEKLLCEIRDILKEKQGTGNVASRED